jgi:hypothetical protein
MRSRIRASSTGFGSSWFTICLVIAPGIAESKMHSGDSVLDQYLTSLTSAWERTVDNGGAVPQGTNMLRELHLGNYDLLGLCSRCGEQLEWWQSKDCYSTWDSTIWKFMHMNWLAIGLASIHYVFIITPSRVQWLLLNSGCPALTVIFGIAGAHLYLLVLWAYQWYRFADHWVVRRGLTVIHGAFYQAWWKCHCH